jgi:hypothetical protein
MASLWCPHHPFARVVDGKCTGEVSIGQVCGRVVEPQAPVEDAGVQLNLTTEQAFMLLGFIDTHAWQLDGACGTDAMAEAIAEVRQMLRTDKVMKWQP